MYKTILISIALIFSVQIAKAKLKIPVCIPCENISKIQELPDTTAFVGEKNEHLNIGYLYNEYGILWLSFWNTGGKVVLVNDEGDKYYDLTEAELKNITETYHIDISSNPLSFWKKMGGKIILLLVLGLFLWSKFSKK